MNQAPLKKFCARESVLTDINQARLGMAMAIDAQEWKRCSFT
jgi:hypothetical protein